MPLSRLDQTKLCPRACWLSSPCQSGAVAQIYRYEAGEGKWSWN